MHDGDIVNYVALEIDDAAKVNRLQIAYWPKRARNTKPPSLWFEGCRGNPDSVAATAVTDLELPLSTICGITVSPKVSVGVRT